jgi:hypothetical protein
METLSALEVDPEGETAAISRPTERRGTIMNAAAPSVKINTLTGGLVREHQRSADVGVRFSHIVFSAVLGLQPDGITLATERAPVARDEPNWGLLCHRNFPESSITAHPDTVLPDPARQEPTPSAIDCQGKMLENEWE